MGTGAMMGTYIFESINQFAVASRNTPTHYGLGYQDKWWNDGMSQEETYQMAVRGDDSLVARAEEMLEKIDSAVETPRTQWVPSPYGAYPIVGDYLAGSVDCMRRMQHVQGENHPIKIWVDLNCSAGFSAEQLLKHGTAILALMMKLEQSRPITLNLVCALPTRHTIIVVGVNSTPLSLSEACFGLCKVAFCRNLMFGYATKKDRGFSDRIIPTERELRQYLGDLVAPEDLVVKGPYIGDPIMEDPIKWVNEQVRKYTEGDEE